MRIYILSNSAVKKNIINKLEPYFHEVRHISYIWSVNGLLQVENNLIYRIKIKDVLSRKTLLGAYPVTIDESEFIREEECYQIAPRAYREYTTLKSYRLPPGLVTLPNAMQSSTMQSSTMQSSTMQSSTTQSSTMHSSTMQSSAMQSSATPLEWIMEYKDDELYDNYFNLSNTEDIHSPKNKAELLYFLNL